MNQRSFYDVLGVAPDATAEQITRAFRERAKKLHPDKNFGRESPEWNELEDAYTVLSDAGRRARYDATGEWKKPCEKDADAAAWDMIGRAMLAAVEAEIAEDAKSMQSMFVYMAWDKVYFSQDYVKRTRQELARGDEQARMFLAQQTKVRLRLDAVIGKASPKDAAADNRLDAVVRKKIADVEMAMEKIEAERKIAARAMEILDQYKVPQSGSAAPPGDWLHSLLSGKLPPSHKPQLPYGKSAAADMLKKGLTGDEHQ